MNDDAKRDHFGPNHDRYHLPKENNDQISFLK